MNCFCGLLRVSFAWSFSGCWVMLLAFGDITVGYEIMHRWRLNILWVSFLRTCTIKIHYIIFYLNYLC